MNYKLKPKIYRVWKQKNGDKIKIKDMTESYILNCIKLLERFHKMKIENLRRIADYFDKQEIDDEIYHLEINEWHDFADDYIYTFKKELGRRAQ